MSLALVAGACGGGGAADTTAASPSSTVTTTTTAPPVDIGVQWMRVPDPAGELGGADHQAMHGVAAWESGLVAVGADGGRAAIWLSVDGVAWQRVPHDEGILGGDVGDQVIWAVTPGRQGLTAVGDDFAFGAAWMLTGGTLIRIPHAAGVFGGSPNQTMRAVTAGGPGLVAVGYSHDPMGGFGTRDAVVWTSIDGLIWNRIPHAEAVFGGRTAQGMAGDQMMLGVTAGGPGVVAVGVDGGNAAVWVSTDGYAWSRVADDEEVFGGTGDVVMRAVVAGGPGLVAVGRSGDDAAVWTSEDGRTWVRAPSPGAGFGGPGTRVMSAVIVGGPGLIAVGSEKTDPSPVGLSRPVVWTSADGVTWQRLTSRGFAAGQVIEAVTAGGPGVVAVGYVSTTDSGLDAAVWVSPPPG